MGRKAGVHDVTIKFKGHNLNEQLKPIKTYMNELDKKYFWQVKNLFFKLKNWNNYLYDFFFLLKNKMKHFRTNKNEVTLFGTLK